MGARVIWALGLLLVGLLGVHSDPGCELRGTRKTRGTGDFKTFHPRSNDPRLPTGIKPISYYLQLQPYIDHDTFRGHVFINMSVSEPRSVITLHAAPDLRIKHVTLDEAYSTSNPASDVPTVLRIDKDTDNSLLFVYLSKELDPGAFYRFGAEFSGHTNTKTTEGLFKAHYVDQDTGVTRWYIAASFKPNLARTAFPCFDEPAMKAVFTVSIARRRESELHTISNMPHATTLPMINDQTWVWDTFEASPPMSTYAVSFLTSDLVVPGDEEVRQETTGVPEVRVWSRAALTEQTAWARYVAPKALSFLERRLRVRFPLTKVDLVALPGYNAPQPAENWGLVFYREGDILSSGYNRWVTNYVVSELTRQWIGGLVTPEWWSETWLNRALVTFVTDSTTADLGHPEERALHEQAMVNIIYSLYYEYSQRVPYKRQSDMRESIVSSKALVVLNMLNSTLGDETLATTLHDVLSKRQYSSYEQSDLWTALDKRAHGDGSLPLSVSAKAVAESWISNERFPVLTVTRDYLGTLNLAQRVFLRDPVSENEDENASGVEDDDNDDTVGLWWVPVLLAPQPERRAGGVPDLSLYRTPALWMPPTRRIDNLSDPAQPDRFLLVNPEELGLIMVNYDRRNWALLAEHLRRDDVEPIPPATRAKLLHDALNLAMGSALDFGSALDVTRFLATETRPEPWQPFFNVADHLLRKLDGTTAGKLFAEYVLRLVINLDKIEKGEGKLRSNARRLLCKLGHETCVRKSRDAYARWMRSETPDAKIPPHGTLCPVFAWGSREEYKFGVELLTRSATTAGDDRLSLLIALAGCARDPWRLERLLNTTFLEKYQDEPTFSAVDQRYIMMHLAGSHSGYLSLFRFLQKNFDVLKSSLHGRSTLWSTFVGTATAYFKTYDELQMVSEFARLRRGQFSTAEKALRRAMQRVELEAAWSQRHLGIIQSWLTKELV